ncbi:uncharacterized zinc protease y4wA-like, partial [Ylistrum balloti]|uniref:uncharacterized zinc protease y4wA-like n=1 Tax=Ylistrum balloti TaxID=509963 RepID=UPI00290586A9
MATETMNVNQDAFGQAETVVLDNGLRILLLEDHSAPVVSLQNWVRFGGADEEEVVAGVAHVFEHMLFKGSQQFPQGEMASMIESAGGHVNAWTSNDETVYHLTVSSRYWQQGFDALADAVLNPLFDAEELKRELEVVQEEIRRGKDSPDRELWYRLSKLLYQEHPYGRPVIGYPETVNKIGRDELIRIFKSWYVPNNMVFVAVGDFKREELLERLQKTYGERLQQQLPERPRPSEPAQQQPRVDTFNFRAELARVEIAFPGIAASHQDLAALDLLSDILGTGGNSILYDVLKRQRQLALDVSAYNYTPKDPGAFILGASFETKYAKDVIQTLIQEANRAQELQITAADLEAAKTRIISQFVHAQETYQGIARYLGRFDTTYGNPQFGQAYIASLRQLTQEDLQRVAATYLKSAQANIVLLVPTGDPLPSKQEVLNWAKQAESLDPESKAVATLLGHDEQANVSWYQLPNGVRLVHQEDKKSPLVSMYASFGLGVWAEPEGKEGITRLMTSLWDQGTSSLSPTELERRLDSLGASIGASAGQDVIALSGRFLKDKLSESLELFFDVLQQPAFAQRELDIERLDQLRELEALREHKYRYTAQQFRSHFYENHPYGRSILGSVESLNAISRPDIQKIHHQLLSETEIVIGISGNISAKEAIDKVEQLFAKTLLARQMVTPKKIKPLSKKDTFSEIVLKDTGSQTHIIWGFPTVDRLHVDRAALRVLDAILSGMGGRLFMELRDQK